MFKQISCFLALISINAFAQTVPPVLKNNNCVTCHTINKKLMGPSWKEISQKYKEQPEANSIINQAISKGSANKWGSMPMPASPQISQDQVQEISKWILQQ